MPKRLELIIEGVILASRWLLVLFYLASRSPSQSTPPPSV